MSYIIITTEISIQMDLWHAIMEIWRCMAEFTRCRYAGFTGERVQGCVDQYYLGIVSITNAKLKLLLCQK